MEYCFIEGYKGGKLLYLKDEKNLYVRKNFENGVETFICYQTIMHKGNKIDHLNCTARVKLDENKICTRNKIVHTKHESHEIHYRDLETLNAIKENCRMLQKIIPITAHKVSAKEIFLQEMAK